jgi:hypothetical protein
MDRSFEAENVASLERLTALLSRLSDEQLMHPLSDGWTVSAVLAHVAFYDRRAAIAIDRLRTDGVKVSPLDVQVANDAMKPQWLLLPPRPVVAEALEAARLANEAVARCSDAEAGLIGGLEVDIFRSHHRDEHLAEIKQVLGLS